MNPAIHGSQPDRRLASKRMSNNPEACGIHKRQLLQNI